MRYFVNRFTSDFRARRHLDLYAVAFVAFVFAGLSVAGDPLPENMKWTAALAALGLLVLRVALPEKEESDSVEALLADRAVFADDPLSPKLQSATEICIFAPSGVNVLTPEHCESLRKGVLSRKTGRVRIVVLDPEEDAAIAYAVRQLDDSLDYPVQDFRDSLRVVLRQLEKMAGWDVAGIFEHGYLPYNPGFSLVAIDPYLPSGEVIVEFHGYHNASTASRMHMHLTLAKSERWYAYWLWQFETMWENAKTATKGS